MHYYQRVLVYVPGEPLGERGKRDQHRDWKRDQMEKIKQCLRNSDGYYCLLKEIKINLLALEDILNCRVINYFPNHTRSRCKSKCYEQKYTWNDWINVVTWEWRHLTYGSYCFPLFKGSMYHVLTLVQLFSLSCPLVHSCREGLVVRWQRASEHRVEYSDPAETMHRRANFHTKQNSNSSRQLQVINSSHKPYCDILLFIHNLDKICNSRSLHEWFDAEIGAVSSNTLNIVGEYPCETNESEMNRSIFRVHISLLVDSIN